MEHIPSTPVAREISITSAALEGVNVGGESTRARSESLSRLYVEAKEENLAEESNRENKIRTRRYENNIEHSDIAAITTSTLSTSKLEYSKHYSSISVFHKDYHCEELSGAQVIAAIT